MLSPTNKTYKPQPLNQAGKLSRLTGFILLLVWVAALSLLAANRQNLSDWWRLRQYQVPAAVAQLAAQDTMTGYARKVFYINQPELAAKTSFGSNCPNNGGEQTIVLGCYSSGCPISNFLTRLLPHSEVPDCNPQESRSGIFLLKVSDPRLDGVQQVTAAHEMLHAAYDRLSSTDRTKVDAMLTNYYDHEVHDQRLQDVIAAYQKSEPHDVVNEMHSVFGTEVSHLPPGLEHYYQRYFTDRSQVAAFAAQYQAAFTSRQARVAQYDTQLDSLKARVTAAQLDLKTKQAAITVQQQYLLNLRASGNASAYNAGVPAYNQLVDAYNIEVATIKNLVEQYNQLVAVRNAVALEQDQLSKELNSNVTPISR